MRIVLLGPPGAGKGTQAIRLAAALNVAHLATGDMLRGEVAAGSDLGKLARGYMDRGDLVPDDVIIGMIKQRLAGAQGMILDGFPRTVPQAEALDRSLEDAGLPLDRVIFFNVDPDELVRRLSSRATCSKCQRPYNLIDAPPGTQGVCDHCGGEVVTREDDRPEAVRHRMEVYQRQTSPVLDYYRDNGRVAEIDGQGTPDEVYERLLAAARD
ncbi:MAG: adenylate kinase [Dehalococcoidia bacterium]